MCRRGSSHILTNGYTGGVEGKGRFASVGGAISKGPGGARLPVLGVHGLTYDPGCIAEVACTRRVGRHAGGEKR